MDNLTELMARLAPADPNHLTASDLARLHQLVQNGQVGVDHLAALYRQRPETVGQQIEAQQALNASARQLLGAAEAGQRQTLAAFHAALVNLTETMGRLAAQPDANSELAAVRLAQLTTDYARLATALADRLAGVNQDNHRAWARMLATGAMAGVGMATIAATYLLNRGDRL